MPSPPRSDLPVGRQDRHRRYWKTGGARSCRLGRRLRCGVARVAAQAAPLARHGGLAGRQDAPAPPRRHHFLVARCDGPTGAGARTIGQGRPHPDRHLRRGQGPGGGLRQPSGFRMGLGLWRVQGAERGFRLRRRRDAGAGPFRRLQCDTRSDLERDVGQALENARPRRQDPALGCGSGGRPRRGMWWHRVAIGVAGDYGVGHVQWPSPAHVEGRPR
mmetsp:Transcript_114880/g.321040  ORF Transcript_114880/g.321040 Transcript_114880/m.321040 type:complete len:217 (-) Transcript_114880:324-974(-)